jgi:hypothetical protein
MAIMMAIETDEPYPSETLRSIPEQNKQPTPARVSYARVLERCATALTLVFSVGCYLQMLSSLFSDVFLEYVK